MTRRNVIVVGLIAALLVAGAATSFIQDSRRDANADAAFDDLAVSATVEPILDCPYGEASCVLALGIERALQHGNFDAVMELAAPHFYVCPGPSDPGAPSPLCDGVDADEGRFGYPVADVQGGNSVVDEGTLRDLMESAVQGARPNAQDSIGRGDLKLYAFSCRQPAYPEQNVSCAKEGIIFSAIVWQGSSIRRELLVFWAEGGFQGRTLPFTELSKGVLTDDEAVIVFQTGGEVEGLGKVHVIDQSLRR
jgi:hypothetical protein